MKNIEKSYKELLEENGIKKVIGISGGSDNKTKEVEDIIKESMDVYKDYPVAILTGGTKWGVPKTASTIAKDYGLKTIGVYPARGEKYALDDSLIDLKIKVEPRMKNSEWGDESEIFSKLVDGVEIIGGSNGTMIEYSHIMKANEGKIKKSKEPVYIAPVSGLGGFSQMIYLLPKNENLEKCLPNYEIIFGNIAANFLVEKLFPNQ